MTIEKRFNVQEDDFFFNNIYLPFIKQIKYPKKQSIIYVLNKRRCEILKKPIKEKYKFIFDYPENDNSVIGIEVFYMGEINE